MFQDENIQKILAENPTDGNNQTTDTELNETTESTQELMES